MANHLKLESKMREAAYYIQFRKDSYIVYLVAPIKGDPNNLAELSKYLTIANYGLVNGNFELDYNDGEIRYKVFVDCDGVKELSEAVIEDSIFVPPHMMDRYGDGIAALAMGFSDADTEIKKAEKSAAESESQE